METNSEERGESRPEAHYTVGELARAANVTPRTIRFYTTEGLLPPCETQGKYAVYNDTHLNRLRLIQRLKAIYLPLATIRAQLASLTEREVRALLGSHPESETKDALRIRPGLKMRIEATGPHAGQSSADYVAQMLAVSGQTGEAKDKREADAASGLVRPRRVLLVSPILPRSPTHSPRQAAPVARGEQVVPSGAEGYTPGSETWERTILAPGAELHLRADPDTPEARAHRARLVAVVRAVMQAAGSPDRAAGSQELDEAGIRAPIEPSEPPNA